MLSWTLKFLMAAALAALVASSEVAPGAVVIAKIAVAVLLGFLEVLGEVRVRRGFGAAQIPVVVLVQGVEARIVRRLVGKRIAHSQRQRRGADQQCFRDSHVTSSAIKSTKECCRICARHAHGGRRLSAASRR